MSSFSLKIEGLNFAYPGSNRSAIENFNLEAAPGEILHLPSPSGSGKTTLFKLIVRLLPPPSGTIFLDGQDITRMPIGRLRKRIKFMITPPAFFDAKIEESFKIVGITKGSPEMEALFHALNLPMSTLNKMAFELSYGEQQRLNLARALLIRPQLLLLDEPVHGMDKGLIEEVFRLLTGLCKKEGLGLLIASHTDFPDFVRSSRAFKRVPFPVPHPTAAKDPQG